MSTPRCLARRGARCILTVKAGQPGLHAQLKALPWREVPVTSGARQTGHRRREHRTLKVTAVARGLAVPRAAPAIQVTRRRAAARKGKKGKWATETVDASTSLTAAQASPAKLAAMPRGHGAIEDRLRWIRDVIYDEDRSQIRTATGPRVMATLRNLAISILRLTGHTSIAAALRRHARRPARPPRTVMTC